MKAVAWAVAAIWSVGLLTAVQAHSWVDCLKYDPETKLCLGYSRGYKGRAKVEPNGLYTYRFNAKPTAQPMCNPNGQATESYTDQFPMAIVQPGETIYTTWQGNGHLQNASPTKLDILYYDDPAKEFGAVGERTAAKVAATLDFATSANCYESANPNSVCLGKWTVPKELAPGKTYHFVWFWYFNSNPAGEWYSTCFDLKVATSSHVVSDRPLSAFIPGTCPPPEYSEGVTDAVKAELAKVTALTPANVPDKTVKPPDNNPPPTARLACSKQGRRSRSRRRSAQADRNAVR
ncbi:hypothetical protein LPJ61_000178 [Coemansia biformis]|uniref:DUF7492 domain-containing protein n=1 Tax=Coemansia biformis TaxID=1286918 RepID=A0A9W7YK62_9FUNG|nr:hypothetical protein LPJ61_000178 [Coemansia biformis]